LDAQTTPDRWARDQTKILKASKQNIPVGIKKYLRHQKNIPLEPLVFNGPCNSLETKPSMSVVFASFRNWSLSPVRFLEIAHSYVLSTIGARRCRFDSTCNNLEFEPLIFDGCFATYVGLKFAYGWFRLD
jgi:hypothetical protein